MPRADDYATEVFQYAQWKKQFTLTDDNYVPVNLTGYGARMQVRQSADSSVILCDVSTSGSPPGITLGSPTATDGTINVTITAAKTATMPVGVWYWDLFLFDTNGAPDRMTGGVFEVLQPVTQVTSPTVP